MELILWDIYEIRTETPVIGVMFRGRIRKFCLEKDRNILIENTQDINNLVRFAVPANEEVEEIVTYIRTISPDAVAEQVLKAVPNPVLSKLKVNIEGRYKL